MSREFLINLIFLLVINAIIKPLYIFGIDRTIQNVVGEDYGIYFSLLSFTYLFQMINDFGLQNFNARNVSMYPVMINRYFPVITNLKAVLAFLFALLVLLGAWVIGYELDYIKLLMWLIIIQVLTSFLMFLRSNIAGLGHYRIDSLLSIMDKFLLIVVCGYLLLHSQLREEFVIEWFLYAQAGAIAVSVVFASLFLRPRIQFRWQVWDVKMSRIILKQSFPYALIYILMMVYTRIDAVMLERLLSDGVREAFTYASAYRLLDAANMVSYLFVGLLLPMFARLIGKNENIQPLFMTSVKVMAISTAVLTVPLLYQSTPIMELLYYDGDAYSARLLQLLFLGHICISFGHIFGALMIAEGSIKSLIKVYAVGIVVNLIFNFILIPEWKALGAAMSTLLTELIVVGGLAILIYRRFYQLWQPSVIVKITAFGFLCGFTLYTINNILDLPWAYIYFMSIAVCIFLAFVLGIVPSRELLEVMRVNQQLKDKDQD